LFQADILPNPSSTPGMVTIWLSDYILNSAASSLYQLGLLQYYFTAEELPEGNKVCPILINIFTVC